MTTSAIALRQERRIPHRTAQTKRRGRYATVSRTSWYHPSRWPWWTWTYECGHTGQAFDLLIDGTVVVFTEQWLRCPKCALDYAEAHIITCPACGRHILPGSEVLLCLRGELRRLGERLINGYSVKCKRHDFNGQVIGRGTWTHGGFVPFGVPKTS